MGKKPMTTEEAINLAERHFVRDFYTEKKRNQLIAWRAFTYVTGEPIEEAAVPTDGSPKEILEKMLDMYTIKEAV